MLAIISAGLLGLVLPVAVRALRADPRIAAGPITLATTDVVTLLVYFAVATLHFDVMQHDGVHDPCARAPRAKNHPRKKPPR